jgi:two-component system chemotaxis response regulator CheB
MPQRDIVVIGASAGGLEALRTIVKGLPASLRASVLVVVHTTPGGAGLLPEILSRISAVPVAYADTGEALRHGQIYLARRDHHLLVTPHGIRLSHGPRENGFRPAIDPLFRTAARAFGPRVVGVVLSGALSDGTYGLGVIKHHGGATIVQDPDDAIIASMPLRAMQMVEIDQVLPAGQIASAIVQLTTDEISQRRVAMSRSDKLEPQLAAEDTPVSEMEDVFGPPSALTCPDCGGALWEVREDQMVRYQCHVGHQYGPESLEAGQREEIDSALWSAVRVLEEHAELKSRMARRAGENGLATVADGFAEGAQDARHQAQQIRALLLEAEIPNGGSPARAKGSKSGNGVPRQRRPGTGAASDRSKRGKARRR